MWRFKALALTAVVLVTILVGTVVVYAGWDWNAQIDVEGTDVRTQWTVNGGEPAGSADDYSALIHVQLPKEAAVSVIAVADSESLILNQTGGLNCSEDGIEGRVKINVSTQDGDADGVVTLTVTANGNVVGQASGPVSSNISVNVTIPGDCSGN